MASPKLRAIDLFCGAGGLSEGLRQAGFQIVAGSDIDPDACSTYALNFPEAHVVCGDIRQRRVRNELLDASSGIDVVAGGPPCQAFSQVRNHVRVIDDPRNSLYREFVRVVAAVLPTAFVMENVPGLDQMGVRDEIAEDLSLRGQYRVQPQLVDAADFGVPQTRKRLIFIGIRSMERLKPPTLIGSDASRTLTLIRRNGSEPVRYEVQQAPAAHGLVRKLLDPYDVTVVSAYQAIDDLAKLAAGREDDTIPVAELSVSATAYQAASRAGIGDVLTNVSVPRINRDTVLRLRGIPSGGNYRDLTQDLRRRYLTGDKWGPNNGSGSLGRRHYYAYRRLHPDLWSWTLNTKADSVYHYSQERALSVREFARLQSFPDRFVFTTDPRRGRLPGRIDGGAGHSRYRQAGNAVPPLLARAVGLALNRLLEGKSRGRRVEFPAS